MWRRESTYRLLTEPPSTKTYNLAVTDFSKETVETAHLRIAHQDEQSRINQPDLSHLPSFMSQIHSPGH